jgi:UDP-N-acetylmuramyl pentapeptide phosphotransferase/UDP-N-acetylglucosamine-1-phosphate transferase
VSATTVRRRIARFALAAAATRAAYAALTTRPPGGDDEWTRKNHRGESVTLLEGPACVAGAAAAVALNPRLPGRLRAAGTLATVGAGAFGTYDDLAGTDGARGFRGHLSALRRGQVTSGAVKIIGIGATGLVAGALVRDKAVDKVLAGVVVAGSANLVNLLDLRPGRALKAGLVAGAPALARSGPESQLVAPALGAAAALLPEDLGERAMLGDAGANALGALLGVAAASRAGRTGLVVRAAALTALTVASEKVSFTRVIRSTPPLDWFDQLGRRPSARAGAGPR